MIDMSTRTARALYAAGLIVAACASAVNAQTGGAGAAPVAEQSFLDIVWRGSGWLGPIIAALSLASVTFIIEHFWTTRRATIIPEGEPRTVREMIEKRQFKECVDMVSKSRTMFADVLTMGLRHGRHGFEAMQEAVEERAGAWRARLFRKIEYLNIIGNIAPLLGLLGTVVGMIAAFGQMGQGGYGPDELADGISIALVSTFLGLIVAIMSMLFFGICRNRADSLTIAAHAAVVDILEYFRPAVVAPTPAAAAGRPAASPGASPAAPFSASPQPAATPAAMAVSASFPSSPAPAGIANGMSAGGTAQAAPPQGTAPARTNVPNELDDATGSVLPSPAGPA